MRVEILNAIAFILIFLVCFVELQAQIETTVPLVVGQGETYSSLDVGVGSVDVTFNQIVSGGTLTVRTESAPDLMEADIPPYFDQFFPEQTPVFRVKVNGTQHVYDLPVQICITHGGLNAYQDPETLRLMWWRPGSKQLVDVTESIIQNKVCTTLTTFNRRNGEVFTMLVSDFTYTPKGKNVTVSTMGAHSPLDVRTIPVSLTFNRVTATGTTEVATPYKTLNYPVGYVQASPDIQNTQFYVTTTARSNGKVKICVPFVYFRDPESYRLAFTVSESKKLQVLPDTTYNETVIYPSSGGNTAICAVMPAFTSQRGYFQVIETNP